MKKAFKVVVGAIGLMIFFTSMCVYLAWPSYIWGDDSWQIAALAGWIVGNIFIVCLAIMYAYVYTNGE